MSLGTLTLVLHYEEFPKHIPLVLLRRLGVTQSFAAAFDNAGHHPVRTILHLAGSRAAGWRVPRAFIRVHIVKKLSREIHGLTPTSLTGPGPSPRPHRQLGTCSMPHPQLLYAKTIHWALSPKEVLKGQVCLGARPERTHVQPLEALCPDL